MHAVLAATAAALVLHPLSPPLMPETALPAAALVSQALLLLAAPLKAPREGAGPLAWSSLALAGAPAWAAAFAASSAGAEEALLSLAALLGATLLAASLARLRPPGRALAVGGLIALSLSTGLLRFASTALYGVERPWLRLLSPLEIPLAALEPARASPPARPEVGARANPPEVRVESGTAGLFRPGLPVPLETSGPYAAGGESPWYEAAAAGALYPTFHERPGVAGRIDWQPVGPDERLSITLRPGRPERRRRADGWALATPSPPSALAVLEAFDEVPGSPAPWRALEKARGGAPRPLDPALDPGAYDALPAPRFPEAHRARLARTALAGGLALAALTLLLGRVFRGGGGGLLLLLAVLLAALGSALASGAHRPRAAVIERALVRLLPGEEVGARVDTIDVAAPAARAVPSLRVEGAAGLTPILFRRPEPALYALAREGGAEEVHALPLGPMERRIFRLVREIRLAGPIDLEAGRALNRTGLDFALWVEVRGPSAKRGGPLSDGAALGPPLQEGSLFQVGAALDVMGDEGRALRRVIERDVAPAARSGAGFLVLLARAPLPPALASTDAIAHEARPAIVVVALDPG
jgi:hypothetical protein